MKLLKRIIVLFLLCGMVLPALAQIGGIYDITDITMRSSAPAMHAGTRHVSAGVKKHQARQVVYVQQQQQQARLVKTKVASLPPRPKSVLKNYVLAVKNVKGNPVAGLTVQATITDKMNRATTRKLVTNAAGRVQIKGISPLPAHVDLVLAPERQLADGTPEWTLVKPEDASFLVDSGGRRVAELEPLEGLFASNWGMELVAYSAGGRSAHRTGTVKTASAKAAVYEEERAVPVRRNVADFELTAPAGAYVYRPDPNGHDGEAPVGTVGEDGKLDFRLPSAIFDGGVVPLRVVESLPGGETEAVVEEYPHDPYDSVNRITQVPHLVLARVSDVKVSSGIDVNFRTKNVGAALGRRPKTTRLPDGSEWLQNDSAGLWVKHRDGSKAFKGDIIERIRLTSRGAGSVAGLSVGDDWNQLRVRLGEPESATNTEASYLNGGLFFTQGTGLSQEKIASVDIARPRELLEQGTTAFMRRPPLRVYIEDFRGDSRCQVQTVADLKRYLSQMGAVQVAQRQEDADYEISGSTTFSEAKGDLVDLIPKSYKAETLLQYTLTNLADRSDSQHDEILGKSEADYEKDIAIAAGAIGGIDKYVNNIDQTVKRLLEGAAAAAGMDALKQSMARAVKRCPRLSEQATFNGLSDRLYVLANFRAAATGIDYQHGTITFDVGTDDGVVEPGGGRQPSVFELFVGKPDANRAVAEGGLRADYYVAAVVSAGDHTCTAQLRHIMRSIDKSREVLSNEAAPEVVRQIPDPVTGLVSGRMRIRFLPLSGEVDE